MSDFLPPIASAHGAEIDSALIWVHWLMGILFVGWLAFFLFALWRFRRSRNPKASYAGVTGKTNSYLEGAVLVAELVLLFGLAIPLWGDRVQEFPKEQDAVVVRVVGEQFAWNVHYPGPDGVFGKTAIDKIDLASNPLGLDRQDPAAKDDVTTVNQLHLPVNKPVIVHLSAKDVIHSFGVPEMRVKQDAIPGVSIPLWWTPTVTTAAMRERLGNPDFVYEIACAQLCGLGHYRMRGFVTIHEQDAYETWMNERVAELVPSEEGDEFWQ